MAFEALSLKHVGQIKEGLGIASISTQEATWRYVPTKGKEGTQIDLLIDRSDRMINLCEMKFYTEEFVIDKSYAGELLRKRTVFLEETGTKKAMLVTMITTYGIKENSYSGKLVEKSLSMDVFFE